MIDTVKLAEEYPEIIITEKRKVGGNNYRYIFQFINKPNIVMITKEGGLYSCTNKDTITSALNHGAYSDDKIKKLLSSIVNKITDESTAVSNACAFIKQGIDVLYKDSLLLTPYSDAELLEKLAAPTDNQKLVTHLAQSYTMIVDLISYIKRKETKGGLLDAGLSTVNFEQDANIAANIANQNANKPANQANEQPVDNQPVDKQPIDDQPVIEQPVVDDRRTAYYKRLLCRLGLRPRKGVKNEVKRTDAFRHHLNLLVIAQKIGYAYSQNMYYKQLDHLAIQGKYGNNYYLCDTELIPAGEYVFNEDDYLDDMEYGNIANVDQI